MSSRDRGSSSSSSSLPEMDEYNETVKNQIQALVRVIKVARTYREDNVPSLIQEGLYLGSVAAACNKNVLKSYNVTHILTVASSLRPAHPDDFVYKVVRVVDKEDTNLEIYFDECVEFIDEAIKQGGSVLVHCFVGKSRSVTIVIAYLMKKHGMTLSQAFQHVKRKRPVASPNAGFIRQLQDLEKSLQVKGDLSDLTGRMKKQSVVETRAVHANNSFHPPLSLKQESKNPLHNVKREEPTKIVPFGGNL